MTLLALFLHECGHGLGSRLQGIRVSTGFNRVGAPGKRPSDADFREGHMLTGKVTLSDVAGPVVNWVLALACAAWLWHRTVPDRLTLGIAAFGLGNAFVRLVPMAFFFLRAAFGNIALEDEVGWGLGAVKGIEWPVTLEELRAVLGESPGLFFRTPAVFVWPALSLSISLVAVVVMYRGLFRILAPITVAGWRWFAAMPALVFPVVITLAEWLDERVRITW
jgi:hypothetical protein